MYKTEKNAVPNPEKARYEICTIQLVIKNVNNFSENSFFKLLSSKNDPFWCFRWSKHNSQLAKRSF